MRNARAGPGQCRRQLGRNPTGLALRALRAGHVQLSGAVAVLADDSMSIQAGERMAGALRAVLFCSNHTTIVATRAGVFAHAYFPSSTICAVPFLVAVSTQRLCSAAA